jgi:hypothetical protein
MEGWIKLHRKMLDTPLWRCEPFTRGQAWVDLLLMANYEKSFYFKRGVRIDVDRGQLSRSEVELADKWKWSRTKVRKFLNDLEKEQQIIQQKNNVTQIVTIIRYDYYQQESTATNTAEEQQKDSRKTAEKHIKEYKEDKEEKEYKEYKEYKDSFVDKSTERKKSFYNSIAEFKDEYPKDMLRNFYDYWSELNKSQTKMRFELEKTWEISKRLRTWANRDKNLNNGKKETADNVYTA